MSVPATMNEVAAAALPARRVRMRRAWVLIHLWLGITLAFVFAVVLLATRFSQAFARFRQAGPQGG